MKLNIAIIGCRGIPNCYGGFEQLAQHLSEGLAGHGHSATVYNSHRHPYKKKEWNGVKIIHCYDGEYIFGTAGQFLYDLNCIRNARKQKFDVILFLGYTSSSLWWRFFPKNAVIISNMDGLEWKRTKYIRPVKSFLRYAEKLAVKHSNYLIADSMAIQKYLLNKYQRKSEYIAYGATVLNNEDDPFLLRYGIKRKEYYMLMARMEPENNVDMILDGFHNSSSKRRFIVVGKIDNRFGQMIKKKYESDERVIFIGGEYDANVLHGLKYHAAAYFHGHSVGGTNPSLLEAMASRVLICAHNNEFNQAILGTDSYFFTSSSDVTAVVETTAIGEIEINMIQQNFKKINEVFSWDRIIAQYNAFIEQCYKAK